MSEASETPAAAAADVVTVAPAEVSAQEPCAAKAKATNERMQQAQALVKSLSGESLSKCALHRKKWKQLAKIVSDELKAVEEEEESAEAQTNAGDETATADGQPERRLAFPSKATLDTIKAVCAQMATSQVTRGLIVQLLCGLGNVQNEVAQVIVSQLQHFVEQAAAAATKPKTSQAQKRKRSKESE